MPLSITALLPLVARAKLNHRALSIVTITNCRVSAILKTPSMGRDSNLAYNCEVGSRLSPESRCCVTPLRLQTLPPCSNPQYRQQALHPSVQISLPHSFSRFGHSLIGPPPPAGCVQLRQYRILKARRTTLGRRSVPGSVLQALVFPTRQDDDQGIWPVRVGVSGLWCRRLSV